jgi:hypothetical protein
VPERIRIPSQLHEWKEQVTLVLLFNSPARMIHSKTQVLYSNFQGVWIVVADPYFQKAPQRSLHLLVQLQIPHRSNWRQGWNLSVTIDYFERLASCMSGNGSYTWNERAIMGKERLHRFLFSFSFEKSGKRKWLFWARGVQTVRIFQTEIIIFI